MKKAKFLTVTACLICLIAVAFSCLAGCSTETLSREEIAALIGTDDFPVEKIDGSYSIDISDLRQVVGDSDYVVVAEVCDYESTSYSVTGTPLTQYSIQVIENIKGKLDTSIQLSLIKEGGINQDNDRFLVYSGDILPRVGGYYIFCIYGQSSGGIRVCGAGYTLSIYNEENYQEEENYKNIIDAYENEIVSDRTRYSSAYEVD